MSDDVNIEPSQTTDVGEQVNEVNEYETKIAQLTEELEKTKKNLENSRKSEKYAKTKVRFIRKCLKNVVTHSEKRWQEVLLGRGAPAVKVGGLQRG